MTASAPAPPAAAPTGSPDRLATGLAANGDLRWVVVDIRESLEEARLRLDLSPLATVALGRALAGAVLVQRISLKVPMRLTLEISGDGPLGRVLAESRAAGSLRGLVGNPRVPNPDGEKLKIAPAIGRGTLTVVREGPRHRYSSQVELVSGELGDDLTHYLEQSEQIRSAVLLGVLLKPEGVAAAGGLVVEALPGTGEESLRRLEANIRSREGVSAVLDRGGPSALAEMIFDGFEQEVTEQLPLQYHCGCDRDRLLRQLLPLAASDLDELIGPDGRCEAVCAFCGERYLYDADELRITN